MSTSNPNRDEPFDRLIRETLRRSEPSRPSGDCLDAATVAAMIDGTLPAAERAAGEAHASGCDRCQALLAAMARSEVDLAPARIPWWRAPTTRWIGPIAAATAAAAALVIWSVVPDRSTSRAPTGEAASHAASTPAASTAAASAPAPPAPAEAVPKPAAVSPPAAVSALRERPQSAPQSAQALASDERQAAASAEKKAPAAGATESLQPFTGAAAAAKDADLAARAKAANQALSETDADKARAAGAAGVAGGVVASGATSLRDEALQRRPAAPQAEELRGDRLSRADAVRLLVVAPDPAVRWRALERGLVQRSTDGGSTWQTQATGVTATPTAGASPAPLTCWLVGPGGIILLSTDGATWKRVPFPETVDLVSVRASDDKTAIVATSDRRAFRTEDGGQSWVRTPLQDF